MISIECIIIFLACCKQCRDTINKKIIDSKVVDDDDHSEWSQSAESVCSVPDSTDTEPATKKQRLALDTLLGECNKSPVKKTMCKTWSEAHSRTKSDYTKKGTICLQSICNILAPGQEVQLMTSIVESANFRNTCGIAQNENICDSEMLQSLADIYSHAETPRLKRKVLSMMAPHFDLGKIKDLIPSVSYYKYYEAKKFAATSGPCLGLDKEDEKHRRKTISDQLLDHFVGYLMSSQVTIDCPYGTKKYDIQGQSTRVPLIIMKHHHSQVVRQYKAYCAEINIECCSERTYMRILEDIGPNVRKSMRGLDNFLADGLNAIDVLKKYALVLFPVNYETIVKLLDRAKQYLKCDYKVCMHYQNV